MEYERGDKLELVIGEGINWAEEGDMLIFVRNQSDFETSGAIGVTDEKGVLHYIKGYRVACPFGDKKAKAQCLANAPKMYAVLQDSCRNFQGSTAVVGLEEAEKLATSVVSQGETQTIYELKAVKKVSKEPIVADVE